MLNFVSHGWVSACAKQATKLPRSMLDSSMMISRIVALLKKSTTPVVVLLSGAGTSVATGIPDFRSPGGMYETLRPELLTATAREREAMRRDPTAVVSWDIFKKNQLPYLEVRRPFILDIQEGKYRPTLWHYFALILEDKGLLIRSYSQNIDGKRPVQSCLVERERIARGL